MPPGRRVVARRRHPAGRGSVPAGPGASAGASGVAPSVAVMSDPAAPAPSAPVPSGPPTAPVTVPAPGGPAGAPGAGTAGPAGATAVGAATPPGGPAGAQHGPAGPGPTPVTGPPPAPRPATVVQPATSAGPGAAVPTDDPPTSAESAGPHATGPVSDRPPAPRPRRRDPLTRMGPWAPAAGAVLGLVAGLVVVLVLGERADAFDEGLALVFLVVGLTMLGAAAALLADEVRLVRRGAREAAVRPAWVEATAGLINGLTPARLLLGSSAFVLFLAAYVGR